ncbi:hypothetical protein FRACYDRAFT_256176 [Fragilariopsis cylindrus CCMP1102]|uniref:Helicase-associated domain-containing protein n=1 Tax=Fragilariopsis cylindrus CCMP1102 TaxID=635003 RepID=A0A1E7EJV1_9STRA|nr:hypothetical protein FRACYDRAFT_256176 [Fragilariopsis cylindrus CCMP1102]|eukprot:OEU06147.1 hypothetical protein FRACYDRAFT_256176 [Fragilariopsis cylindrus CCMP1102]
MHGDEDKIIEKIQQWWEEPAQLAQELSWEAVDKKKPIKKKRTVSGGGGSGDRRDHASREDGNDSASGRGGVCNRGVARKRAVKLGKLKPPPPPQPSVITGVDTATILSKQQPTAHASLQQNDEEEEENDGDFNKEGDDEDGDSNGSKENDDDFNKEGDDEDEDSNGSKENDDDFNKEGDDEDEDSNGSDDEIICYNTEVTRASRAANRGKIVSNLTKQQQQQRPFSSTKCNEKKTPPRPSPAKSSVGVKKAQQSDDDGDDTQSSPFAALNLVKVNSKIRRSLPSSLSRYSSRHRRFSHTTTYRTTDGTTTTTKNESASGAVAVSVAEMPSSTSSLLSSNNNKKRKSNTAAVDDNNNKKKKSNSYKSTPLAASIANHSANRGKTIQPTSAISTIGNLTSDKVDDDDDSEDDVGDSKDDVPLIPLSSPSDNVTATTYDVTSIIAKKDDTVHNVRPVAVSYTRKRGKGRGSVLPSSTLATANHRQKEGKQQKFGDRLAQLADYKEKNGHCIVPRSFQGYGNLGHWYNRMRQEYKKYKESKPSSMTNERICALEKLDFKWSNVKSTELAKRRDRPLMKFNIRNVNQRPVGSTDKKEMEFVNMKNAITLAWSKVKDLPTNQKPKIEDVIQEQQVLFGLDPSIYLVSSDTIYSRIQCNRPLEAEPEASPISMPEIYRQYTDDAGYRFIKTSIRVHITKDINNQKYTTKERDYLKTYENIDIHNRCRQVLDELIRKDMFTAGSTDAAGGYLPNGILLGAWAGVLTLSLDRIDNTRPHFLEDKPITENLNLVAGGMNNGASIVGRYNDGTCKKIRSMIDASNTESRDSLNRRLNEAWNMPCTMVNTVYATCNSVYNREKNDFIKYKRDRQGSDTTKDGLAMEKFQDQFPDVRALYIHVRNLFIEQHGRCKVSNIIMEKYNDVNCFQVSLDAISPTRRHVKGNLRLICWFLNNAFGPLKVCMTTLTILTTLWPIMTTFSMVAPLSPVTLRGDPSPLSNSAPVKCG